MKRLGKNWKRLHRLVYLAGLVAVLHFAWARKGDLFSLQGDVIMPLVLGAFVLLLLTLRIAYVRKAVTEFRTRVSRRAVQRSTQKVAKRAAKRAAERAAQRGGEQAAIISKPEKIEQI